MADEKLAKALARIEALEAAQAASSMKSELEKRDLRAELEKRDLQAKLEKRNLEAELEKRDMKSELEKRDHQLEQVKATFLAALKEQEQALEARVLAAEQWEASLRAREAALAEAGGSVLGYEKDDVHAVAPAKSVLGFGDSAGPAPQVPDAKTGFKIVGRPPLPRDCRKMSRRRHV